MSNYVWKLSRRQVLRGALGTVAFAVTVKLGACGNDTASNTGDDGGLVMGFIYVGPKDDFGYNQAHAEGAAGAAQAAGIGIIEQASVPETNEVQQVMRDMIELDGAKALFPTSFGYFDPHLLQVAEEYPEVQFLHAGGLYQAGVHPPNVGSYFGYIDEAEYVAGIVAAHATKSGKLGFVAAKPIPQVLRNVNSYTIAARSVNPDIETQLIFTGDWSLPVKEAEATNSLVDQGIDVITCHVDSPKVVIETAEKRGVFCTGYHANQAPLAPNGYLTGAEWNWTSIYTNYAKMILEGKTLQNGGIPHLIRGGLKEGFVKISDYSSSVTDAAKKEADAAKEQLLAGNFIIFPGGLKSNDGKTIIPEGQGHEQTAIELETMNWLVEGVNGSIAG